MACMTEIPLSRGFYTSICSIKLIENHSDELNSASHQTAWKFQYAMIKLKIDAQFN